MRRGMAIEGLALSQGRFKQLPLTLAGDCVIIARSCRGEYVLVVLRVPGGGRGEKVMRHRMCT